MPFCNRFSAHSVFIKPPDLPGEIRRSELDVDRYTPLAKEKAITAEQLDNAIQANIAAKAQAEAAAAGVDTANAAIVAANPSVESAKAAGHTAGLDLSVTRLTPLVAGIA